MSKGVSIPLSVEQLMTQARRQSGVEIVDEEAITPLSIMHKALCEEGGLHAEGALAQQNKLLRLLCNRLRFKRDIASHPEILEQEIVRPLFVLGFARSGTTKTQKALAASGDFNFLPFWQCFNPALFTGDAHESTHPRIAEAEAYCAWFDRMSPDTKKGHPFEAHEPEEDTTLTEHCLVAPSFIGYAEMPSYMGWLATQSPTILFEFLRDALKYLQWQGLAHPQKRWLLKAPTYYGLEAELLRVFPDADFVMTHRSPLATIPSSCQLITEFHKPFSTAPLDRNTLLIGFKAMMDLHIANRGDLPHLRILDLHFDQISRDFGAALDRIYTHIGMTLTPQARSRIDTWDKTNPQHRHGPFRYSLSDYGLSEDAIRTDHARYLDLMMSLFGKT